MFDESIAAQDRIEQLLAEIRTDSASTPAGGAADSGGLPESGTKNEK